MNRDSKGRFIEGHNVSKEWRLSCSEKNREYKHTETAKKKISFATQGDKNPAWKGGRRGYYQRIARKLKGTEGIGRYDLNIHHKDGNVKNNNPSNLRVMTRSEHTKSHWKQGEIRGETI